MPDYDFKNISPPDFEALVRDLFQLLLGYPLEIFASGRDGGIDLRYMEAIDNSQRTIIQCKKYAAFDDLYAKLSKEEVQKVKKLKPSRYILATSTPLTPHQKDRIFELFKPYFQTTGDIFSQGDINGLLARFPMVEKNHFKLWVNSTSFMERIVHSAVYNLTDAAVRRAMKKAKLYVLNESFVQAKNMLEESNYCIVSGPPGIGKTTLAEALMLYYLGEGYEVYKITKISEAFAVSSRNPNDTKQFFYYDDFLGQTSLLERLNDNEENSILEFMELVWKSNRKIVFTTREYILNQAYMELERISYPKISKHKYVLDLSKYTILERAKILYNHLYFSDISAEFKTDILRGKKYMSILNHRNFNPRMIEWMTVFDNLTFETSKEYINIFLSGLEYPQKLWNTIYERKISESSRNLLIMLTSLSGECFLEDIQDAFVKFHEYRSRKYGSQANSMDFVYALKELDGALISSTRHYGKMLINFHDPTVRDFMEHHISNTINNIEDILASAIFFEQCAFLLFLYKKYNDGNIFSNDKFSISNIKHFFVKDTKIIFECFSRTIEANSCAISAQLDLFEGVVREAPLVERRLRIVIEAMDVTSYSKFYHYFDNMLLILSNRIRKQIFRKSDLSLLLHDIYSREELHSKVLENDMFVNSVKNTIADINDIDDFQMFADNVSFLETYISDEEVISI